MSALGVARCNTTVLWGQPVTGLMLKWEEEDCTANQEALSAVQVWSRGVGQEPDRGNTREAENPHGARSMTWAPGKTGGC